IFSQKTDQLVAIAPCPSGGDITVVTTTQRSAQFPLSAIPRQGRDTPTAYRLAPLGKGEKIATVTLTALVDNGANGESASDDSEE
ncbi:MAG TPA: hypothetical protein V6D02_16120, partial [Candidatus Obscuribacterales bacterium]